MYSYGSPHTAAQKQDDQQERTFSSYVRIQVVVLKTYLGRWTIGRSGERGSGISVLPARYDDDDDLKPYNCVQTNDYYQIGIFSQSHIIISVRYEYLQPYNNMPIICIMRVVQKVERRVRDEYFYCGNTIPLLIKIEKNLFRFLS